MSSKETNLKEKFRLALTSTAKVISDDFILKDKFSENKKIKDLDTIEINNLTNPSDFIRLRAETDSAALKKNFPMRPFIRKTYHLMPHQGPFILLLKKLDMSHWVEKC